MTTKILATYAGPENTEARVAQIEGGYSVTVWDLDADEAFSTARIYPSFERADEYARSIA